MRKMLGGAVVASLLLLGAVPASAAPVIIRLDDGLGGVVEVQDQGAGDLNPVVGAVTFSGSIGQYVVNVTTGISAPLPPNGPGMAYLDLNSINVNSGGAGTLTLWVSDDDFTFAGVAPGTTVTATATVGGTLSGGAGSTFNIQSWANPTNAGALDGIAATPGTVPAGSVAIYDPVPVGATFGPGAFSATDTANFTYAGPFALFTRTIINFTSAGSVSFDSENFVPVPEPGSMILLGTGLMGLASAARRRRKQAK